MDPVTGAEIAIGAAEQLPRIRRVLKRVTGLDEFAELMRRVAFEIRRDAGLPHDVRVTVGAKLDELRVDPAVNGIVRRLIAESDVEALDELERHLTKVFDWQEGPVTPEVVAARVVHWLELELPRAMGSEREALVGATRLEASRTRRDITLELGDIREGLDLVLEAVQGPAGHGLPPSIDWAPDWPRKALRALGEIDPTAVKRLREIVDGQGGRQRLLDALDDPPRWMRDGPAEVWEAAARYAEQFGEWRAAAGIWQRLGEDGPAADRALRLLRAGMDSHMAGDDDRFRALLDRAHAADPTHPRVLLEMASLLPWSEQRDRLAAIEPDNDETAALKNCHLALHAMLARDLVEAERLAEEAGRLAPRLLQVRILVANVAIERNRRAIADNEPLEVELAQTARRECLELREELLEMRRWEESTRLLMLAADSYTVAGELDAAEQLLLTAAPEERIGENGEVLAEAALRAMKWMTVGVFLDDHNRSLTARRIRARAKGAYGTADERREAADELDRIIDQAVDRDDRQAAVLSRLVLCVRDPALPWPDDAERVAVEIGEQASALAIKALWLTDNSNPDAAIAVVEPHIPEAWALEARYHVAHKTSAPDAHEWAIEVLATNPDQALRVRCAGTLESVDPRRARAELMTVAKDRRAQRWVRVEAYGGLVTLLLNEDRPEDALRELDAWQKLVPGDAKASALRALASARLTRSRRS